MQCVNMCSRVLAFAMSSMSNDDGEEVATACDASNLNRQYKAHRLYCQLDNGSSEHSLLKCCVDGQTGQKQIVSEEAVVFLLRLDPDARIPGWPDERQRGRRLYFLVAAILRAIKGFEVFKV